MICENCKKLTGGLCEECLKEQVEYFINNNKKVTNMNTTLKWILGAIIVILVIIALSVLSSSKKEVIDTPVVVPTDIGVDVAE